jgi:translation initiation factor 2B subunit (eIF-2B alpha/beta/delta family)
VNLDALVAPLRADVVSGAAVVARAAAAAMSRGAAQLPAGSASELRDVLSQLALRVMDAQPAMAPLVELLTSVLGAVRDDASVDEARRSVVAATEDFRVQVEERAERLAGVLAEEIPHGSTVLTLSSSSTVRGGLVKARDGNLTVICLEGRPMNEGQGLARTLAHSGIDVVLAVDAAADSLVPTADLVLLGADSVGDSGVVNKIGSLAIARSAAEHSVPVWVAADRSKWLPQGFPQVLDDDRPPEEVWRGARGVRVWNRYFECLPNELVSRIVTDAGVMSPGELSSRRRELHAAPVLREWAALHR